jgi:hypothetical protein
MSTSVWAKQYKKDSAKRSAESSGTTISALRREAERRREDRNERAAEVARLNRHNLRAVQ